MSAPAQDEVLDVPGIARAPQAPEPAQREAFGPTRSLHAAVSRTWELEMLISGAVLFGLFQLPGLIDGLQQQLLPHLTERVGPLVFLAHLFGKIIVYATIAVFSVHIVARAYWVGLIGLDSVFPNGIRWDRVSYGPATVSVYRERMPSIPAVIARTDRFCSVLFSFGFLIVITCLFALLGGVLAVAIDYLESWLFSGGRSDRSILPIVLLSLVGISVLLHLADKLLHERLAPDGRSARMLRRMIRVQYTILAAPSYMLVLLTLVTNLPRRLVTSIFYAAFVGLTILVLAEAFVKEDLLRIGNQSYFPDAFSRSAVVTSHYENQRTGRDAYRMVPTIQADVIEDAYVRLFIPYAPQRHNAVIAAQCPDARPLNPGGVRLVLRRRPLEAGSAEADVLRCLAEIHQVTLNGQRLADLDLHFHVHPRTGIPGVLAYLATDNLPRGRNLLTIQPAPRPDDGSDTAPEPPFQIPFWR